MRLPSSDGGSATCARAPLPMIFGAPLDDDRLADLDFLLLPADLQDHDPVAAGDVAGRGGGGFVPLPVGRRCRSRVSPKPGHGSTFSWMRTPIWPALPAFRRLGRPRPEAEGHGLALGDRPRSAGRRPGPTMGPEPGVRTLKCDAAPPPGTSAPVTLVTLRSLPWVLHASEVGSLIRSPGRLASSLGQRCGVVGLRWRPAEDGPASERGRRVRFPVWFSALLDCSPKYLQCLPDFSGVSLRTKYRVDRYSNSMA